MSHTSKLIYLRHTYIYEEEMKSGFRLGLYFWANTGWSGKHAYFDELVEVKIVNVTGFTSNLESIKDLPISHVLYAFDKEDGTVVLPEHNNTIYMGDDMIYSLDNPIQCEDNDVGVDLRPTLFYPNKNNAQLITLPDGT